jgi:hypothetical protein
VTLKLVRFVEVASCSSHIFLLYKHVINRFAPCHSHRTPPAIWSVIQIQAVFRGWYARDSLEDNHYCATQIQRVVRGYLSTMHVFEDLYSITIVQSIIRMHLAINKAVDRLSSIIAIQSWYRGVSTRYEMGEREYSAIAIQSNWRRYLCQMSYQFDIIDIIIVQSIIRRRNAIKEREYLQAEKEDVCAVKIQSAWRSYDCSMSFVRSLQFLFPDFPQIFATFSCDMSSLYSRFTL